MSNCNIDPAFDLPAEHDRIHEVELDILEIDESDRHFKVGGSRWVLVVEDGKNTRPNLKRMLGKWGFEVVLACNGTEVLEVLREPHPPGLVIFNKSLVDMDGIELCRRISGRANDYLPFILMLASESDSSVAVEALAAGASDCLVGPFTEEELKARVAAADRILQRQDALIHARDTFRRQAMIDSLTGVWNRRAIIEVVGRELRRAQRSQRSTGFLLLDLDHFKDVNDTFGHLAGDLVLVQACKRLRDVLRSYDFIGRYGGEEFLIIVPGTDEHGLCTVAERLRSTIESHTTYTGRNEIRVTASIGAAIAPVVETSAADVIAVTDSALYTAKMMGRNRTVFSANTPGATFNLRGAASALAASLAAS
jgi:two-component system, cell cycle response regulator